MKNVLCVPVLALAFASPAYACDSPAIPSNIPDGKSATMDQMVSAKKGVDQYKRDMEAFLGCVKDSGKAESAHAELERIASRFNAEVRAYKAANNGK